MLDIKLKLKPGHTSEREWMKPSRLKTLFWNVTYNCNYLCPVCFTDAGQAQPGELTTEEAFLTVQKIHEAGVHDVIISGGEPFIRRDMIDILEKMAEVGIRTRIASNGSLLTEDILSRLRRHTLTESFQISLDTVDSRFYEKFHNAPSGAFFKVTDILRLIQEYGFHTTVSVRVMPETLSGIPELIDTAVDNGWSTVTLHIPVPTRRVKDAFPAGTDVISLLRPVF
ncbi:MAG: radical SAM protein, partial [Candidatus Aminicenantes bacterium]|nr:radical SAM protein [Candidatus Aminicenantes bacterium]